MGLAGEKIMKIREFVEWYMEAAEIEESWRSALEEWVSSLEGVVNLFHKSLLLSGIGCQIWRTQWWRSQMLRGM